MAIEPGLCCAFLPPYYALVLAGAERSGLWKLLRSSPFVGAAVWCFWRPWHEGVIADGQSVTGCFSHKCSQQMAFELPSDWSFLMLNPNAMKNHVAKWFSRLMIIQKVDPPHCTVFLQLCHGPIASPRTPYDIHGAWLSTVRRWRCRTKVEGISDYRFDQPF